MKYIISVDNFGRKTIEYKGNSKEKAKETFGNLYSAFLDDETTRMIIATTIPEINIYNKRILKEENNET